MTPLLGDALSNAANAVERLGEGHASAEGLHNLLAFTAGACLHAARLFFPHLAQHATTRAAERAVAKRVARLRRRRKTARVVTIIRHNAKVKARS